MQLRHTIGSPRRVPSPPRSGPEWCLVRHGVRATLTARGRRGRWVGKGRVWAGLRPRTQGICRISRVSYCVDRPGLSVSRAGLQHGGNLNCCTIAGSFGRQTPLVCKPRVAASEPNALQEQSDVGPSKPACA